MYPNKIFISRQYKFILDYVRDIPHESTQSVQKTERHHIKFIQGEEEDYLNSADLDEFS